MQWYNRQEAFYKERFNREIGFINKHNNANNNKIKYQIVDNNFVVYFSIKAKKFKLTYPSNYPSEAISMDIQSKTKIKGHHKYSWECFNDDYKWQGTICYEHNDWNQNWGIDYMYERAKDWLQNGRFNRNNDALLSDSKNLFIVPKAIDKNILQKWGYFEYVKWKENTFLITKFVNSKYCLEFETYPFINIHSCTPLKGLYLANFDFSYHSEGKVPILKRCIQKSISKKHKDFISFIISKKVTFPFRILNINKKTLKTQMFELNKKKLYVNVAKVNKIEDKENIIVDKEQLNKVKNKKIAFVGAGAIGSTLICQLVKSGLEKLIVVDNDILEIGNLYRHELSLEDLGNNKAIAMKEKIKKINPSIECEAFNIDAIEIVDELLKCDLIISTVDNEKTRLILDEQLIPKNKTIIHINSFYDSIAGIVFIANKLKSSCYHCFEYYLVNVLTNSNLPDFKKLEEENPLRECGSNSVPGNSPNTSQIANYGAKVILNFLSNGYSKDANGNNINLYVYSNDGIHQGDNVYFENSPKVEKFFSPSYNNCQVCSHDRYEVSEETTTNYIKNMETIEN